MPEPSCLNHGALNVDVLHRHDPHSPGKSTGAVLNVELLGSGIEEWILMVASTGSIFFFNP